ncbi:HD domain-containing protein [Halanaerobiaceae bacterium Z-7014]|uniref:HD domain-containing protein n=1 Tax=Halonatronomonas betaini TaxID=2778430 RepID=A0A931AW72_9FIRM|nr:HD domain-containing phosphohydrolase [Halonatronomonas betaini]MBF8437221.1 HD domain-containing protein [Halonatronomonas betaini]
MIGGGNNKSISLTLIITFLLLIGIPLLIIVGLVWRYSISETTENINNQNMNLARSLSGQIEGYFETAEQTANNIENHLNHNQSLADNISYLNSILENNNRLKSVLITDNTGKVRVEAPYNLGMSGLFKRLPVFNDDQVYYWTNSYISHRDQELTAEVVKDFSEGYIFLEIDLTRLNQYIDGITDKHDLFIFDRDGVALAGTIAEPIRQQENFYRFDFIQSALNGEEVVTRENSPIHHDIHLISSTNLDRLGWAVAVFMPADEAYGLINQISQIMLIGIIMTIILGLLVGWRNLNYITKPLKDLTEETEKIANGNREINSIKDGYLEVNQLSESFKTMIEEIRENELELKEKQEELHASYEQLEALNEETTAMNEELEASYDQINSQVEQLEKIIDLTVNLKVAEGIDENKFLEDLLDTAIQIVPEADYGSIVKYYQDHAEFVYSIGHDYNILKDLKIDKEIFELESKDEITVINHIYDTTIPYLKARDREKFITATRPIKETMIFDLYIDGEKMIGLSLDIKEDSNKYFDRNSEKSMQAFQNLASAFYSMQYYSKLQSEFQRDILSAMLSLLSIHDEYTESHSQHVAELSSQIASELGLSNKQIKETYWAGLVHDIGKTLIPDQILNKQSGLDPDEYEVIKNHPRWGYEALRTSSRLEEIARYVLYHHEREDGKGYPVGLSGDEIPIVSKILNVADAWDAMTSKRSYRDPLPYEEAKDELVENSGSQFSEEVVEVFLKLYEKNKFL